VAWFFWANLPDIWDKRLLDYTHPDDRKTVEDCFARALIRNEVTVCEARWYCPAVGGKLVWARTTFHPVNRDHLHVAAIAIHHILIDRTDSFAESAKCFSFSPRTSASVRSVSECLSRRAPLTARSE
jgi:hypothetical protein